MRAFIKFNNGILGMPRRWQLWVAMLVAANGLGPLFFLGRLEAQVVLFSMLVGGMLMTWLTGRFGFTRIVGLGHVVWLPMLAFLLGRLGDIPASDAFGIWIRAVIVLDSLSLFFDAVDFVRYVAGDRAEKVAGL